MQGFLIINQIYRTLFYHETFPISYVEQRLQISSLHQNNFTHHSVVTKKYSINWPFKSNNESSLGKVPLQCISQKPLLHATYTIHYYVYLSGSPKQKFVYTMEMIVSNISMYCCLVLP